MKFQKSFKKLTAIFATLMLVMNIGAPISVYASSDVIAENTTPGEIISQEVAGNNETPMVEAETVSPVAAIVPAAVNRITGIFVESDNLDSIEWAKAGNRVAISFISDLELTSPAVTVDDNDTGATEADTNNGTLNELGKHEYIFYYQVGEIDSINDGQLKFSITDSSVEIATEANATKNVTVDNTVPEVTPVANYQLTTRPLSYQRYLNDEGVVINEATGSVDVETIWSIPNKNADNSYSYEVIYLVADSAGNKSSASVDVVLGEDFLDERVTSSTLTKFELKGGAKVNAELGKEYTDEGVTIAWDANTYGSEIEMCVSGNLNTAISGLYQLNYKAIELLSNLSLNRAVSSENTITDPTREITVSDTIKPSSVKNFKLTPGNGYIGLNWENPTDADFAGVQIWRSTVSGERGTRLLSYITSKTTNSFEDSTVVNGVTYYYTLIAVDTAGNESEASDQLFATPISPKIVSADVNYGFYDSSSSLETVVEEKDEVKGSEDKKDEEEKESIFNKEVAGIKVWHWLLIVLAIGGGYYWFAGWKNKRSAKSKPSLSKTKTKSNSKPKNIKKKK